MFNIKRVIHLCAFFIFCAWILTPVTAIAKKTDFSSRWTLLVSYTKKPNSEIQNKNWEKSFDTTYSNLTKDQIKKLPKKIQDSIYEYEVEKALEAQTKFNAPIKENESVYKLTTNILKVDLKEIDVTCEAKVIDELLDWPLADCVDNKSKLHIRLRAEDCINPVPVKKDRYDKIILHVLHKDIGQFEHSYDLRFACKNK